MQTTTTPSKVCFQKMILSSAYIVGGAAVQWEPLDGNRGVLCLTPGKDDSLIAALNDAASKHIGGVLKISEEDADLLKKNHTPSTSVQRPREMLELMRTAASAIFQRPPRTQENAAPVAEAKPVPAPAAPAPAQASTPQPSKSTFKPLVSRASQQPKPAEPADPGL